MIRISPRLLFVLALMAAPSAAQAQGALKRETLIEYIRGRDDLSRSERHVWETEIRKRFGGAALKEESKINVEITVAKEIISGAIFMGVPAAKAIPAAWEGWRGALGYVPPPIAVEYQILVLQGRQPRGRPIDLAFKFPDFYNEEIAPDLVAYWEQALKEGTIPDDALLETKEALGATRIKMRPLLLDKLRLMSRLARVKSHAQGARRAEAESDLRALEEELQKSFSGVARRPEVLDARKRPYDRLRIQLEDMGLPLGAEDRELDPESAPPPRRPVPLEPGTRPRDEPPPPPVVEDPVTPPPPPPPPPPPEPDREPATREPTRPPPPPPPPPQARDGEPDADMKPLGPRAYNDLVNAYSTRLIGTIGPWLGTPYLWGGTQKRSGTDCSGFTMGVMDEGFAIKLPRVSRDQYRTGVSVPRESLQAGDLIFFDTLDAGKITHVGVFQGKNKFAHAASKQGVTYSELNQKYYEKAYRGARRVLAYPPQ